MVQYRSREQFRVPELPFVGKQRPGIFRKLFQQTTTSSQRPLQGEGGEQLRDKEAEVERGSVSNQQDARITSSTDPEAAKPPAQSRRVDLLKWPERVLEKCQANERIPVRERTVGPALGVYAAYKETRRTEKMILCLPRV